MLPDNLFCIDLDQPALPGFRQFISAWHLEVNGRNLLVDPGPLSTIDRLVAALHQRGIKRLDTILLTHIHIDHAGGTGALLRAFPEARVICHPDGVRHLVDPKRLWQGSLKVLGRTAEVYGEIVPVPADRIGHAETVEGTGIEVHLTPGHAPHHCCYRLGDLLFAGEVAGVRCTIGKGIYMRPATPPRFLLEVALDSVRRMCELQPQRMVFAHHGLVDDAAGHLRIAHRQLRLWVRGAAAVLAAGHDDSAAFLDWLLARDEVFRNLGQLDTDLQQRERDFVGNTYRGMRDYVTGLDAAARAALLADDGDTALSAP